MFGRSGAGFFGPLSALDPESLTPLKLASGFPSLPAADTTLTSQLPFPALKLGLTERSSRHATEHANFAIRSRSR